MDKATVRAQRGLMRNEDTLEDQSHICDFYKISIQFILHGGALDFSFSHITDLVFTFLVLA